ncbi:hypothetical protein VII00023_08069 [Vibrio ichthyoenteri ATCC 700023]|uniref:Uncharacterized protein n=1 Tax=Vibrio ichthyoenteri ATCC 700023 TaxID=870968 RepID=F9S1W9_9VIBR|nr:hypothetical protein [Vibrio ichthyoenteri]EGU40874.1 hypothetical protein VII00023_08069 [Vibrio ichthyoenteri ATCC 700023]
MQVANVNQQIFDTTAPVKSNSPSSLSAVTNKLFTALAGKMNVLSTPSKESKEHEKALKKAIEYGSNPRAFINIHLLDKEYNLLKYNFKESYLQWVVNQSSCSIDSYGENLQKNAMSFSEHLCWSNEVYKQLNKVDKQTDLSTLKLSLEQRILGHFGKANVNNITKLSST